MLTLEHGFLITRVAFEPLALPVQNQNQNFRIVLNPCRDKTWTEIEVDKHYD